MRQRAFLVALLAALTACRTLPREEEEPRDRLDLSFEGNASQAARVLRKVIADNVVDLERRGFSRAAVDDAAYEIEAHHRREGFPYAKVAYRIEEQEGGRRVVFRIDEGPRTVIEEIKIQGNQAFPSETLLRFFQGPRGGIAGRGPLYYVEAEVEGGARAIEGYYNGEGYLRARVAKPEVVFSEDRRKVRVRVTVEEGIVFRLTEVRLEGEPVYAGEELRPLFGEQIEKPFRPGLPQEIRGRLLEFYGSRGHPHPAIALDRAIDFETGEVVLTFTIGPGPVVTISQVLFGGNRATRRSFLLSRLRLREGDRYSLKAERESFRRLFATGLFDRVRLEIPEEGEERRPLLVTVEEAPSLEFFVEPGFGSYELARLRAGFVEKNLAGTGRVLRAEVTGAVRAQKALLGLTDPWFLGSEISADVPSFVLRREEPSFTRFEVGTGIVFTRRWTPRLQSSFGYAYRHTRATGIRVEDEDARRAAENLDISSLTFSQTYDSRDDIFAPRSGMRARASLEWGDGVIGSELDFLRPLYSQSHYLPLTPTTTLALSLQAGAILPVRDSSSIPIQERFFNGGDRSVRSFRESELGPKDKDGDPLGGEAFQVWSVELRQRIAGNLEGAVFYDTGNVVPDHRDFFRFEGFRAGAGLGLRYLLPIGPVRLDGAVNPNPRAGEDRFVVHLSVGMPF